MSMSTNERIKEMRALIAAKQSEISRRQLYLLNTARYEAELKSEEQKLLYQQQRVDRLKAIREDGEEGIHQYHLEIEELKRQLKLLVNADVIEAYTKLLARVDKLSPEEQDQLRAVLDRASAHA